MQSLGEDRGPERESALFLKSDALQFKMVGPNYVSRILPH